MIGVGSRKPGAGSRESGAGSRESGAGSQGSGVRSQESGVRSQGSGAGSQEKEKIGAQKSLSVLRGEKGMEYLCAKVVIHGLVQGVNFRASTREEAERLGVGGGVRNLPDGNVQALIEEIGRASCRER